MPETKTRPTGVSVEAFLNAVEPAQRRADGLRLDAIFRDVTGFEPRMWGPTIVGYGRYVYRYASGHGGETAASGFSPRKTSLVVYIVPGYAGLGPELARLGKHRIGKSCLYLNRLADIDEAVLRDIVRLGLEDLGRRWQILPV